MPHLQVYLPCPGLLWSHLESSTLGMWMSVFQLLQASSLSLPLDPKSGLSLFYCVTVCFVADTSHYFFSEADTQKTQTIHT